MVFECGTCDRQFLAGWRARDQHCQATGHTPPRFECDVCDEYFCDDEDRVNHMYYNDHWAEDALECAVCPLKYRGSALREHEAQAHLFCSECDRYFQNHNNIQQHFKSSRHRTSDLSCPFCNKACNTATGLVHRLERGACPNAPLNRDVLYRAIRERDPNGLISNRSLEWYGERSFEIDPKDAWNSQSLAFECYLCHQLFNSHHGLKQHLESPKHQQKLYHCPNQSCRKESATLAAMINHLESETCSFMRFQQVQNNIKNIVASNRIITQFPSGNGARDRHCDATGHEPPEFECGLCGRYFDDGEDCQEHEINNHLYCSDCDREFSNWNNIQQHLNSSRHRQWSGQLDVQRGVVCPFCRAKYGAASGLTHHLERGCCPRAPLDRDTLYKEIRRCDPNGVISNRFLEWNGTISYEATELAWNRRYQQYECYLCHTLFKHLSGLNQHLESPRHQQKLYHCPNRACFKEFTTLAGLINHLESESCSFMRFEAVQNGVRGLVSSNRLIGFS
ncbi:hypothetical protein FZEAL_8215 [Fusarium zealandicum]|uniref:C2H2-type domain-containing protein n=1 Tax=Fusarium zealandicum TaxID=1053134 RepID=A0A8H4UF20_9HYPO|nr:hypothetical protein FZEAL_8215 [Fusarium zealandicum]